MSGKISLILGPMFSGKTSSMITEIKRYKIAKKNCLIITHKSDNRYDSLKKSNTSIISHDKIEYTDTNIINVNKLEGIDISNYDVIGIDEIGFFDDIELIINWANQGKIIIAAGLDGDYKQESFGNIHKLIPHSEELIKKKAICMECYGEASFTHRLSNEKETIIIGSNDKYVSLCRVCLLNKQKE